MQNIETESYLSASSGPLRLLRNFAFAKSEDTTLATLGAWTLGLVVFTLAGFYFGTIAGHDNSPVNTAGKAIKHQDLNVDQLSAAIKYAASGLGIGILFALIVTFVYVPAKLKELANEQGGH